MITQFLEKKINEKEHNDNSMLLALKGSVWNSYVFSLFLREVMNANEFETKEK